MGEIAFKRKIRKFESVGLDSMIFIYQFGRHPKFYPLTHYIFTLIGKQKLYAVTSLISLIEALSFREIKTRPELIESYKNVFTKTRGVETINPNLQIAEKAALLRREYNLRTPDAIQLATAIVNKAEIFITNDDRFRKIPHFPILLLKDFAALPLRGRPSQKR